MHCPNCGTQVSAEQKFCRACGLELQAIARLVTQQLAEKTGAVPTQTGATPSARMFRFLFAGFCVSMCGGTLLTVNNVLDIDRIFNLHAMFLVLIGALLALYGVIAPKLHPPQMIAHLLQPAELPAADTTSKLALESGAEPGSSVVEHTTRTLEPVVAEPGDQS